MEESFHQLIRLHLACASVILMHISAFAYTRVEGVEIMSC